MQGPLSSLNDRLLDRQHLESRGVLSRPVDPLRRFLKILGLRRGDLQELLRIPIDQWEPRALNVDHQAMAPAEGMIDVGQLEFDLLDLARSERLGLLIAV